MSFISSTTSELNAKQTEYAIGILYCLAATFLFWMANVVGKMAAESYPVPLIVFFRSAFALIACFIFAFISGERNVLRSKHYPTLMIRGVIWVLMLGCSIASFHMLDLTDAAAIEFAGPIIVAILAGFILGETVGIHRWLAILLGFIGVMMIVRPGFGSGGLGILFAFGNAFFYAVGSLIVRHLGHKESSTTIVLYACLTAVVISGTIAPLYWEMPDARMIGLLSLLGLFGGTAQILVTKSLQFAPASVVSPISYSGLIWVLIFGFLFWNEIPDFLGILGAFLILVSGLYLALGNKRKIHNPD